jgi:hypothetical protein
MRKPRKRPRNAGSCGCWQVIIWCVNEMPTEHGTPNTRIEFAVQEAESQAKFVGAGSGDSGPGTDAEGVQRIGGDEGGAERSDCDENGDEGSND